MREQNFVKWDWGVDISVFTDEFFNKIDPLTELLKKQDLKFREKKNKMILKFILWVNAQ